MQIKKSYSGSLDSLGSARARVIGLDTTVSMNQYDSKTDFVNQTIADFLHDDCGVDAKYDVGNGSTEKFLWIYGAPFLFIDSATSGTSITYCYCYGYLNNLTTNSQPVVLENPTNRRLAFFLSPTSLNYSFSLGFVGNPKNGFCLRVISYGTTVFSNFIPLFIKTTNILTGQNSMVYTSPNAVTANNPASMLYNAFPVTFNSDGTIDHEHTNNQYPSGYIQAIGTSQYTQSSKDLASGKFPLIPIMFGGIHKPNGIYMVPVGFGLPNALSFNIETQPEVTINGRKFILTSLPGASNSSGLAFISCGLIEVTD